MLIRLIPALAIAILVAGCSAPPEADSAAGSGPVPLGTKPFPGVYLQQTADPGAGYRLEIHPDGKWAMANMSAGFWGIWTQKDGKVALTITDGSSGKLGSPTPLYMIYEGADTVRLGEEWGSEPFQRQQAGTQYLISFDDTSLAGR